MPVEIGVKDLSKLVIDMIEKETGSRPGSPHRPEGMGGDIYIEGILHKTAIPKAKEKHGKEALATHDRFRRLYWREQAYLLLDELYAISQQEGTVGENIKGMKLNEEIIEKVKRRLLEE